MPNAKQFTLSAETTLGPVYANIRRITDGKAWNGSALEVFDPAHWSTYTKPLTDQGGGQWSLTILKSELPTGDNYLFNFYEQQAGAPAASDTKLLSQPAKQWAIEATDEGNILVDHDTGGTDNLRAVTPGGSGIEADVTAYLTSEFGAGAIARGESHTDSAGRWAKPMKLFAGAYTFTFDAPGYTLGSIAQEIA